MIKRVAIVLAWFLVVAGADGQMTTSERLAAVSDFARALGLSESFADGVLRPSRATVLGKSMSPRFSLWKGERRFEISDDLTLRSFVDMSDEAYSPRTISREKFPTDASAWDALDTLLRNLDAPPSLTRHSAVRLHGESEPAPIIRLLMRDKPYGYVAQGGNTVLAEFHRQTGRVLKLTISTGWSYEPPNARVSSSQAIDQAIALRGGVREDWSSFLEYWTSSDPNAPVGIRELRVLRKMRLCYNVFGARGSVLVDSVTGDVVVNTSPASTVERALSTGREAVSSLKPDLGKPVSPTTDQVSPHKIEPATRVIGYIAGAGAAAVAAVWAWRYGRRRR